MIIQGIYYIKLEAIRYQNRGTERHAKRDRIRPGQIIKIQETRAQAKRSNQRSIARGKRAKREIREEQIRQEESINPS